MGSEAEVTVYGSDFQAGAVVLLEDGQGRPPTVSDVVVLDANTLTAHLAIPAAGPKQDRLWTVRVTNPDGGTAVLPASFTVTVSQGPNGPSATQ